MNDEEFMRLMSGSHRAQTKKLAERLEREYANCVSVVRAHRIARNPDEATAKEKAQIANCPHCAKLMVQVRRIVPQPSPNAV